VSRRETKQAKAAGHMLVNTHDVNAVKLGNRLWLSCDAVPFESLAGKRGAIVGMGICLFNYASSALSMVG
jgi:hypothetical protein